MTTKDRPRLGRGLKGLISSPPVIVNASDSSSPSDSASSSRHAGLQNVDLALIDNNPHQPRESIDPLALAELAASIRATGVLQPIILRPVGDRFQLIAGHRRTAAARQIGLQTIPALLRPDATDEHQAEWALIENIQRQDLNAIERAKAYRAYVERFSLTHAQAAQRLGEDRTVITNFMRLLELNPGVQDLVGRGLLSAGHAKVLAGIADVSRQDALANRAVTEGMSVRKLEEILTHSPDTLGSPTTTPVSAHARTLTAKSPHVLELEQELSHKLGTKVRIFPSRKKNTGKIVIQYFSLDEFDRLVEKFK